MVKKAEHEKLARCAYCNSEKVKITHTGEHYQGLCNKCFARGPKKRDRELAVEAWNRSYYTRFIDVEYTVESEQLRKLIAGDISVRCITQHDYNILLEVLKENGVNITFNVESGLWGRYEEETAVRVSNNKYFGYQNTEYFMKIGTAVEDLVLERRKQ